MSKFSDDSINFFNKLCSFLGGTASYFIDSLYSSFCLCKHCAVLAILADLFLLMDAPKPNGMSLKMLIQCALVGDHFHSDDAIVA